MQSTTTIKIPKQLQEPVDYNECLPDQPEVDENGDIAIAMEDHKSAVKILNNVRAKLRSAPFVKSKIVLSAFMNFFIIHIKDEVEDKSAFYQEQVRPSLVAKKQYEVSDYNAVLPDEPEINDKGEIRLNLGKHIAEMISTNLRLKVRRISEFKSKVGVRLSGNFLIIKIKDTVEDKLAFYQNQFKPRLIGRGQSEAVDYEPYLPDWPEMNEKGQIVVPVNDGVAAKIANNMQTKINRTRALKSKVSVRPSGDYIIITVIHHVTLEDKLEFYQQIIRPGLIGRKQKETVTYKDYLPDQPEMNEKDEFVIDVGLDAPKIASNMQSKLSNITTLKSRVSVSGLGNYIIIRITDKEIKSREDKLLFYQTEIMPKFIHRKPYEKMNYKDYLPEQPVINEKGQIVRDVGNQAIVVARNIRSKLACHPDIKSKVIVSSLKNVLTIEIKDDVEDKLAFYRNEFCRILFNERNSNTNRRTSTSTEQTEMTVEGNILDAIVVSTQGNANTMETEESPTKKQKLDSEETEYDLAVEVLQTLSTPPGARNVRQFGVFPYSTAQAEPGYRDDDDQKNKLR